MSSIPAFTYSFIIYLSLYYKSVSIKTAKGFVILGSMSVLFVFLFNWMFPYFYMFPNTGTPILDLFIKMFLQVALTEELSKFIAFETIHLVRSDSKTDNPSGVMFYSVMVSVGFAIVENLTYAERLIGGEISVQSLLMQRSVTSVFAHMMCGLFMGYFIALSKQRITNPDTTLKIWLKMNPRIKKWLFVTLGLGVATLFHGFYDFIVTLNINPLKILLIGGIVAYYMNEHLKRISKDLHGKGVI